MFTINKVADEIKAGEDELSDWIKKDGKVLIQPIPPDIDQHFTQVSKWIEKQQYKQAAIDEFLRKADFYLVAHALAKKHVLVTHEARSNAQNRIKIPDACQGLNVQFMTPYQMLRNEKARFVLEPRP